MDHKDCDHSHCTHTNTSVCQTLSEMDWERGLWYAEDISFVTAFYGEEARVKDLINKARNANELVNTPDNSGYTPLHYAARKGYTNICKILLQYGAHIDAETKSGKATPLHKAAAAGKMETIQFLIQSGARKVAQDADGQTILHKAIEHKHHELVKYLMETCHELAIVKDMKGHCATDYKSGHSN